LEPLEACPRDLLGRVRILCTDIDDTLTTDGRLTAAAYGALERLARAGVAVVPVTGRPAGWCDHFARMWPVTGVVGENGAFWFAYDHDARRMTKRFREDAATRARHRERLVAVRDRILAEVPGSAVADDQHYRETDLAIDFCEDVPRLPQPAVERIVRLMTDAGMTARVSSIHVNGWFGTYDKLGMTRAFAAERLDASPEALATEAAFIGDSPNDAPMFAAFPLAVGVANVRDFAGRMPAEPRFVTRQRSGAGFVELADAILSARASRADDGFDLLGGEGGLGAP
jgi:HAD superfamily hydrolase (TIGR01484 family)